MKKSSIIITVILITILPHALFAWGKTGHGIVAEIAFSFLDNNAKQSVQKYLGTTTIEQASTWMDEVRSDHSYDYMKPWHYVNIEKGGQYIATKDDNIINALNATISKLEHKDKLTDAKIKQNLMILFHLVGDFHQPLHLGYGIDKGGNDIKVTYLGKPANLHSVWDTEIIESEKISANDCLVLYKEINKKTLTSLKEINIEQWIDEPRQLLENVYDFTNNTITHSYVDKNKEVVERQLLVAGIRLAAVLEFVFKS